MSPIVTVYLKSSSRSCRNLTEWLDEKSIHYRGVIVDKQDQGFNELAIVSNGNKHVPFIVIDFGGRLEKIDGFKPRALEAALL